VVFGTWLLIVGIPSLLASSGETIRVLFNFVEQITARRRPWLRHLDQQVRKSEGAYRLHFPDSTLGCVALVLGPVTMLLALNL
jgi:hypothetical protein